MVSLLSALSDRIVTRVITHMVLESFVVRPSNHHRTVDYFFRIVRRVATAERRMILIKCIKCSPSFQLTAFLCDSAARSGLLGSIVSRLSAHDKATKLAVGYSTAAYAAECGDLSFLMYAISQLGDVNWMIPIFSAANGHLLCLRYAYESQSLKWSSRTPEMAAKNGSLDCLRYAQKQGCDWNSNAMAIYAAESGSLVCLKYVIEHGGCPFDRMVIQVAAEKGYLDLIIYAVENGCPVSKFSKIIAAENGHQLCYDYLHSNGY